MFLDISPGQLLHLDLAEYVVFSVPDYKNALFNHFSIKYPEVTKT